MIPRYLIYWVNSIGNPLCALADDEAAFANGDVICALAGHLIGKTFHFTNIKQDAESKVQAVLTYFKDKYGLDEIPSGLCEKDSAQKIVDGSKRNDSPELVSLLEYMFILSARIVNNKENAYNSQISGAVKSDLASLKQKVSKGTIKSAGASNSEEDPYDFDVDTNTTTMVATKDKVPRRVPIARQTVKRQNVVRVSYPLRKVHSRGQDSYVQDCVKDDEEKLVEEAVLDEQEGRLLPGVIMPVRQYIERAHYPITGLRQRRESTYEHPMSCIRDSKQPRGAEMLQDED